jgi:hypothetical protein
MTVLKLHFCPARRFTTPFLFLVPGIDLEMQWSVCLACLHDNMQLVCENLSTTLLNICAAECFWVHSLQTIPHGLAQDSISDESFGSVLPRKMITLIETQLLDKLKESARSDSDFENNGSACAAPR